METFSALLAICAGNSPVTNEFPAQKPVTRSFDVFFDMCLNKRLSKQSWGWWFETPSRPLWRHSDDGQNYITWIISNTEIVSMSWRHRGNVAGVALYHFVCRWSGLFENRHQTMNFWLNTSKKYRHRLDLLYKGHPRWWPFKRGGLSWGVK